MIRNRQKVGNAFLYVLCHLREKHSWNRTSKSWKNIYSEKFKVSECCGISSSRDKWVNNMLHIKKLYNFFFFWKFTERFFFFATFMCMLLELPHFQEDRLIRCKGDWSGCNITSLWRFDTDTVMKRLISSRRLAGIQKISWAKRCRQLWKLNFGCPVYVTDRAAVISYLLHLNCSVSLS